MRLIGFRGTKQPRQFNYIPQYYDEREERLKNLMEEYDTDDPSSIEAMKARISLGLTSKPAYYDNLKVAYKQRKASNIRVLLIVAILLMLCMSFLGTNFDKLEAFIK